MPEPASQPPSSPGGEVTDVEKTRRLKWVVLHNGLNTFFASIVIGGPVIVLFLAELGLPKTRVGFLLALFPFCGLLALLITPFTERFGAKRAVITFLGIRKLVVLLLLVAPWLSTRASAGAVFGYVAAVIFAVAVCRAIAETAFYPWTHEFVPAKIRGRFGAACNVVSGVSGALSLGLASWLLSRTSGFTGYQVLLTAGSLVGVLGVVMLIPVAGGAPVPGCGRAFPVVADLRQCGRDRNFVLYLAGVGSLVLAGAPMAFLPLFLRERIGLSDSYVVMVQTPVLIGTLLTALAWGWAVDRYGSKPILISSLSASLALPFCWLLLPCGTLWSGPLALAVALASGILGTGIGAASGVWIYNRIVPAERKTAYYAIFYAWAGLTGGLSPLAAGWLLDRFQSFPVTVLGRRRAHGARPALVPARPGRARVADPEIPGVVFSGQPVHRGRGDPPLFLGGNRGRPARRDPAPGRGQEPAEPPGDHRGDPRSQFQCAV